MQKKGAILATIVLGILGLVLAGCGASGKDPSGGSQAKPQAATIGKARVETIWLGKFERLVEAHAPGESPHTLHSPGVEQKCTLGESAYQCEGVVPEEEGSFVPGHETNCEWVTMTIDKAGHITQESSAPISQVRESAHANIECHL